ncbi:acylneuraminate cytidylyltransferase [Spirochaetia bacterium 38H-sp]|uniref:Acylneuraminate cytidylyltransferase n=1 Tax=Rarispira pelagica TaxID=3141764 RepID=A0ABU9UAK1_9SPIR
MTVVFLQARMDSSRLPAKAMLNIMGKTLIAHAMSALKCVDADAHVLLTDFESANYFFDIASLEGFEIFAGSKEDVLDRFVSAARAYDADTIVRATGDNPLVSSVVANMSLLAHKRMDNDYTVYKDIPIGTGVEVVKRDALEYAHKHSRRSYDREHVTPFLYANPEIFRLAYLDPPSELSFPDARVTVDTFDDYVRVYNIFSHLYEGYPIELKNLVAWLKEHIKVSASS